MIVSIPSSVTLLITELLRDGAHPTLSQERACAQLTHYESSGRNTKTHTEHKNPHPHHGELPPPLAALIFLNTRSNANVTRTRGWGEVLSK